MKIPRRPLGTEDRRRGEKLYLEIYIFGALVEALNVDKIAIGKEV